MAVENEEPTVEVEVVAGSEDDKAEFTKTARNMTETFICVDSEI